MDVQLVWVSCALPRVKVKLSCEPDCFFSHFTPLPAHILAACSRPHVSKHSTGNQGLFARREEHGASVEGKKRKEKIEEKMTLGIDAILGGHFL